MGVGVFITRKKSIFTQSKDVNSEVLLIRTKLALMPEPH